MGDFRESDRIWAELDSMKRPRERAYYRPGGAELAWALDRFRRRELTEAELASAEHVAKEAHNRVAVRSLAHLRGQWQLDRGAFAEAVESFSTALSLAREVNQDDLKSEAALALARLCNGDARDAAAEAERLNPCEGEAAYYVARLWQMLGEREKAIAAALRAHRWAVGDGEPFVWRLELARTRALLTELGAHLPEVPTHDPTGLEPYPWEGEVADFIHQRETARSLDEEPVRN